MKHYLLTRMNKGYVGRVKNPTEWLRYRMKLFEKYCLPSVQKQINQNFIWLLLFDKRTPDKYLKYNGIIFDDVKNYIDKDEWTITTRLDNDDMIHKKFIDKIQSLFVRKTLLIGAKNNILIEGKGYYKDRTKPHKSPFISLIEPPGVKNTVGEMPHTKMSEKYDYKNINEVLCTHVQHKKNISDYTKNII